MEDRDYIFSAPNWLNHNEYPDFEDAHSLKFRVRQFLSSVNNSVKNSISLYFPPKS